MPRDHYLPRTYLRQFTKESLTGQRGGLLTVYSLSSFRHRRASIGKQIGYEENLYANHRADKRWQAEESKWPSVVTALQSSSIDPAILTDLIRFAAIQTARVPINLEQLARTMSYRKARRISLPNRPGKVGLMLDMVNTTELLDEAEKKIPSLILVFSSYTEWTCYHNGTSELFITSDNPCVVFPKQFSYFPLTANLAVVGKHLVVPKAPTSLRHRIATPELVRKINVLVARNAHDFLYVTEITSELDKFIRKHRKGIDRMNMMGRTFTQRPNPITETDLHNLVGRVNRLREAAGRERI